MLKRYNEFNIKVPTEIIELSKLFKDNGKKLYIVGGYCRDMLMGKSPKDIDLATDSLPDESIKFLSPKYHIDLVGKSFGVIIVHLGSTKIEIASFRKDLEDISGGRHPEIELGVNIEDDVLRRDITISALFYDIENKKIVDIVGGKKDIENKIIRMVGDPNLRLKEDQLRSLRVLRFACRYQFDIDDLTSKALRNTDLSRISNERIWEEFKKSFEQSINFSTYLKYINYYNMWDEIFPGSNINQTIIDSNSFQVYIANLFRFDQDINLEKKLVSNYKMEIDIARQVIFLIDFINMDQDNVFDMYKSKIRCHIKDETILEWLRVLGKNKKVFSGLWKFLEYRPSVSSEELMSKGFKGKSLGDEIKRLETEKFIKML